jgi:hypothetical protein
MPCSIASATAGNMKVDPRYQVFGLVVESDLPLNSIDGYSGTSSTDVRIRLANADYFLKNAPATEPDPDDWVRHAVCQDGTVYLRGENVFEAIISSDGRDVACRKLGNSDARSVEANLVNFALCTCLTLRGEEPLHSTAVEIEGRTIGLLGRSGVGKSTLAAFLISRGAVFVTDDMLRLQFADCGGILAYPGPHRLKLFEEPAGRYLPAAVAEGHFNPLSCKIMVRPPGSSSAPSHLRRLSALLCLDLRDEAGPTEQATLERLRGGALARTLISSAMDDRYAESQRLLRQLAFASRIARQVPVFSLRYRRSYDEMPKVAEVIERMVLQ